MTDTEILNGVIAHQLCLSGPVIPFKRKTALYGVFYDEELIAQHSEPKRALEKAIRKLNKAK